MLEKDTHLSDEELLLFADGEFSPYRAAQARRHLAACWDCRTRMAEIEGTISDFVRIYHASLDPQLPPAAGPRALLEARLAESALISPRKSWRGLFEFTLSKRQWLYICVALFLVTLGIWVGVYQTPRESPSAMVLLRPELIPNRNLTPGAIRLVKRGDVCGGEGEDDNDPAWLIPASVRQEALREYGVAGSQAKEYQLDYLIPPALGGTEDIRNLWPEPYSGTVWNAHAKDVLENRLRALVCEGKLSLPDAQRDIATDWISTYKRYLHADQPAVNPGRSGSARPTDPSHST